MKMILVTLVAAVVILSGCTSSSDSVQQDQQEKLLEQGTQQTGMPNIHNFFERKMMKMILEKRDKPDLTTYVYTQALDGKFVYMGRAIGYGLPYSAEYTNPEKYIGNQTTLPQADPNGLFSPSSSEATWLLMVDDKTNESKITYMEPRTIVSETKLPKRLCEDWSLPSNY